ncbi:hypothetical protein HZA57_00095 [Candidatus Poribacteria bacterium]|nr:hypothetical protein [Candidatus Poribacteria bacterium]
MPYIPKLRHLFKILFRVRDPQAAEGLFLEGSIEFDNGQFETARMMFFFGTRLDPGLAGNFHNLAVTIEKIEGPGRKALTAWENYLRAAKSDTRQSAGAQERAAKHASDLRSKMVTE